MGQRIVVGTYSVGEALPREADLAESLGVSRSVLREAIKVLAAKGLVESRPKTGIRVRPRDDWHLLDPDVLHWQYLSGHRSRLVEELVEVRRVIEPAAAKFAAQRAEGSRLERITAAWERMQSCADDFESFIEADLEFHAAILAACGNELLIRMNNTIVDVMRAQRWVTVRDSVDAHRTLPVHGELYDAIVAREPASAAEAADRTLDRLDDDLKAAGPFAKTGEVKP